MDDRTAYSILKIRPGTSHEDISRRYEHFIKLYKRYLMGQSINMSPEEIEQMKRAYVHLLYKRIGDDELKDLYPPENTSLGHQLWESSCKATRPFLVRHKAKVIYTLIMCVLTYIIIAVRNYQPVDLKIAVLSQSESSSIYEMEIESMTADAYEVILTENLSGVKRPKIEFQGYLYENEAGLGMTMNTISDEYDVYIMDERLLKELKARGVTFLSLDRYMSTKTDQAYNPFLQGDQSISEVYIDNDTSLYQYVCNLRNDNRVWVAVVYSESKHLGQALQFIKYINDSNE